MVPLYSPLLSSSRARDSSYFAGHPATAGWSAARRGDASLQAAGLVQNVAAGPVNAVTTASQLSTARALRISSDYKYRGLLAASGSGGHRRGKRSET